MTRDTLGRPSGSGLEARAEALRVVQARVTEAELEREVRRLAGVFGYRSYHTFSSRRSPAGFPDLVLCHAGQGRVLFAELKSGAGRVTRGRLAFDRLGRPRWVTGQEEWLADLARCAGVEVYVWLPSDVLAGDVAAILQDGPRDDMPCVSRLRAVLTEPPAGQAQGGRR